jgi:uncharacterized membrane protein (DUF485 family)
MLRDSFKKLYILIFEFIFINPTHEMFSLQISASRWGTTSLLSSCALFLLALYISAYAIWLSWTEGNMTPPLNPNILATGALVVLVLGIIFVILTVLFVMYFLFTQNDTYEAKINKQRDEAIYKTAELVTKIYNIERIRHSQRSNRKRE